MSDFLTQLFKGFVRSAVNQVGRDGGRMISKDLYADVHKLARPTPQADSNDFIAKDGSVVAFPESRVPNEWIMENLTPIIYRTSFWGNVGKLALFAVLPGIGEVYMLVKAAEEFFVREVEYEGLKVVPRYVVDHRYKEGYRQDGFTMRRISFLLPVGSYKILFIVKGLIWIALAVGMAYVHYPIVIKLMSRF